MTTGESPGRILHIIETGGPGGAETVLAGLVDGLGERGWVSRVVLPEVDWLSRRLGQSGGADLSVIASHGSADLRYLRALVRELRSFRPDVIHAHLLASGVYGSLAARLSGGIPLVMTFHGAPDVNPADRLLPVKSRILRRGRNRIVYVSKDLRRRLETLLRIPERIGRVVHNGIDFFERLPDSGLRAELGVSEDAVVVGALGNLRTPKDYPNLLQAAAVAVRENPRLVFVVVGGGPPEIETPLLELRRELGLDAAVPFLGFRDDPREVLSGFDVFVSSSSSEGLPLATLEAMGAGLPAVLTDCGGPGEIVRPSETGWLVPPRDPQALAAAILDAASDPVRARSFGERGKADVRRRFSKKAMIDGYEALYGELGVSRRPPRA